MHIGSLLPRQARYRPDHPAVVFDGEAFTFRRFNARVNRVAHALLAAGLRKGDALATVLPNGLALLELYWAAAKTGIVAVPMSPLLQASGLTALLADAGAVMVVGHAALADTLEGVRPALPAIRPDRWILTEGARAGFRPWRELLAGAPETEPPDAGLGGSDPYNIIYSSGTTGEPKGIVHTHAVRATYATFGATAFRMTPESVILHAGSIVFNGAFTMLMPWAMLGATYVLHRAFEPGAVIADIERYRVTHIVMVPSQIVALLNHPAFAPAALASLQMLQSVGAPLHLEHKQRLNAALPGRFHELYGLTEGFVTVLDRADNVRKIGSVGVPPPFVEMRLVDDQGRDVPPGEVGEICGRGPLLMTGYYRRPDLTARAIVDGWLHSGDLGYVDEDGFLYLVDRKKDLIISGGVNVYPRDIEEVVVQHPAVREAAVFGVPDPKWGETPVAAVVLRTPGQATAAELLAWANERVAARYQRVHDVWLVDDLPRNVAGKTLKRVLTVSYRERAAG
jgi:long-chain acyl-CoA synthetase